MPGSAGRPQWSPVHVLTVQGNFSEIRKTIRNVVLMLSGLIKNKIHIHVGQPSIMAVVPLEVTEVGKRQTFTF